MYAKRNCVRGSLESGPQYPGPLGLSPMTFWPCHIGKTWFRWAAERRRT